MALSVHLPIGRVAASSCPVAQHRCVAAGFPVPSATMLCDHTTTSKLRVPERVRASGLTTHVTRGPQGSTHRAGLRGVGCGQPQEAVRAIGIRIGCCRVHRDGALGKGSGNTGQPLLLGGPAAGGSGPKPQEALKGRRVLGLVAVGRA